MQKKVDKSLISNYVEDMNNSNIAHLIGVVREKVNRFLMQELKRYGVQGLAASHGSILYHLFTEERVSMKKLAEIVDRDKSTVTALVDKLVKLGYVTKNSGALDLRFTYVTLTPKGKELEPTFWEISSNLIGRIFADIPEDEQREVVRILTKISGNF